MSEDSEALRIAAVNAAADITVELLKHREQNDAASEANAITTFQAVYRNIRSTLCTESSK